jgi:hypothetical protein
VIYGLPKAKSQKPKILLRDALRGYKGKRIESLEPLLGPIARRGGDIALQVIHLFLSIIPSI